MTEAPTLRHERNSLPVRSLRLDVVEGPDAGKRHLAASDLVTIGTAAGNDLVLTDDTVSRYHLEIRQAAGRIQIEDHGSTNGTVIAGMEIDRARIQPGTVLQLGKTRIRIEDGDTIEVELFDADRLGPMRGRTSGMRRLMAQIHKASRTDAALLVLGETGTGKEVVAQAIHESSPRVGKPFETVDCGSLLPTLVASELFGHERGAFTGAVDRHVGAFERADGGTIFLDEIGELPPALQAALLGVLERKSFRRVGGTKPISVDVRVIAATNRDLRHEVNQGTFRADLYYRLAVLTFRLPPLRERTDDIPLLVEHFLREAGSTADVDQVVPREVMATLKKYRWPGNVRELRNFVEAALAMGEAPILDADGNGPPAPGSEPARSAGGTAAEGTGGEVVDVRVGDIAGHGYRETRDKVLHLFEHQYLTALVARTKGNVASAAREANMDRSYLIELLKKHGMK